MLLHSSLLNTTGVDKCGWCWTPVVWMNGFLPSDTTELPTRGAWQRLRTAVGSNLNIAQIDIECPYHSIASPLALSELMVLLPFRPAYLVTNCPELMLLTCVHDLWALDSPCSS